MRKPAFFDNISMQVRRALESFVLQKKLNPRKLRNLLAVAEAAERLSSRPYLERSELDGIVERYGVRPDVTTWGDFFAAEIATDHWEKSDAEFERICETVLFDFIAAAMVFSGKSSEFIASALRNYEASLAKEAGLRTADDEEKIHLGILAGYYREMGLDKARLSDQDMEFFESFSVKTKTA
jgi:hypothetical protein